MEVNIAFYSGENEGLLHNCRQGKQAELWFCEFLQLLDGNSCQCKCLSWANQAPIPCPASFRRGCTDWRRLWWRSSESVSELGFTAFFLVFGFFLNGPSFSHHLLASLSFSISLSCSGTLAWFGAFSNAHASDLWQYEGFKWRDPIFSSGTRQSGYR